LASDLAYLEAWARAAAAEPLVWLLSEPTLLRFIAHHLWDEEEREKNPEHGMPRQVAESLRADDRLKSTGPHAPATVCRRLSPWSSLHRWRGLEGPFSAPSIRNALCLAIRVADRPRARKCSSSAATIPANARRRQCRGSFRDRTRHLQAIGAARPRRPVARSLAVGFRAHELVRQF